MTYKLSRVIKWENHDGRTGVEGISPIVFVLAQLEFKFMYYDVAVQTVSHNTQRLPCSPKLMRSKVIS